ncbi:hypothetical protein NP233_g9471 [Leucocoprinus birnbaumii]|uniref:Uncharacterized protein n=1 Tax=Leucocoprinus birnbaumii TaxID=56174 RepID=A0AAD5VKQ9_9AGAR|nr:hypothetical protein NP233_g9471 [Leucocoprinus birnbaumii]
MYNLTSITWTLQDSKDNQVEWMNDLAQNIGAHPTLTDFALDVWGAQPLPLLSLQPLSRLHDFSFEWHPKAPIHPEFESEVAALITRCYDLKRLKLQLPYIESPHATLAGFFQGSSSLERPLRWQRLLLVIQGILVHAEDFISNKHHFRFLEDLTLDLTIGVDRGRPYYTDEIGEVFSALRVEEVYLKRLSLTDLHPPRYRGIYLLMLWHCGTLHQVPRAHISENAESFSALEDLKIEVHTSDEDLRRGDAGHLVGVELNSKQRVAKADDNIRCTVHLAGNRAEISSTASYPVREDPYD